MKSDGLLFSYVAKVTFQLTLKNEVGTSFFNSQTLLFVGTIILIYSSTGESLLYKTFNF